MNHHTKDLHIGMRGVIDYPGTYLHGKDAVIDQLCGREIFLAYDLGSIWLEHTHFVPQVQDVTDGAAGASKEEKQ
jgi:hypothetical protein